MIFALFLALLKKYVILILYNEINWRIRMNTNKAVQHVADTGFKAVGIVAATGAVGSHLPAAIVA